MEANGRPIIAIVDTGSQLNAVNARIAAKVLKQPVNMQCTTTMMDANGGNGDLQGYIHEAELSCGMKTILGIKNNQSIRRTLLPPSLLRYNHQESPIGIMIFSNLVTL
jgi:hypothetical protein